jgi:hypothetical protein
VFGLFGIGRNATPSEIIINKLATNRFQSVTILNKLSGKALTVEDSSTNQGARIQQVTRNGAANQRWFVKRMKFIAQRIIPGVVDRKVLAWSTVLRFSHAVYSVIADHSGLCLDILNDSTDNSAAVQQLPVNRGNNQLWAFVPDRKGFNLLSTYTVAKCWMWQISRSITTHKYDTIRSLEGIANDGNLSIRDFQVRRLALSCEPITHIYRERSEWNHFDIHFVSS